MLIMRRSEKKSVNGHPVEILQAALRVQGLPVGLVDGDFGPKTERALKLWQKARGLPETGEVSEVEWRGATGLEPPSLFDRLMQVLSSYEGTDFGGVVGNFDGAYLTFGLIGFTLKHDLPNLLADIEAELPADARRLFGAQRWEELLEVSRGSNAQKEAFGNRLSAGPKKFKVVQPWRDAFAALGAQTAVRRLQLRRAYDKYYIGIALRDAARFGASTVREVGLFFDTAIQNGGVNRKKRDLIEAAFEANPRASVAKRMELLATAIADGSARRWREDVLRRRNVFAKGEGVVHGEAYRIDDWGLEQGPADLEELAADRITVMPDTFRPPPDATPAAMPAPAVAANTNYLEEVPVDPSLNDGLRPVSNALMLSCFGQPRANYGQDCRSPTESRLRDLCAFDVSIPPFEFRLWGLGKAVESLREVLADIEREEPGVFAILGHLGMGCCRFQRGSTTKISNHSWGSAIDLTLEGVLDTRGNGVMQRGIMEIAPIFNRHFWYSGAKFRTEDAMHMEISRDWLEKHFPDLDPGQRVDDDLLGIGDSGPRVIELQRQLQTKGFTLAVDGDFGINTLSAVRAFQGANGLVVDGIVGERTWAALA